MTAILKRGSKGVAVVDLQTRLAVLGHRLIGDGNFGPATEGAVRSFQAAHGLVVDGIAGPQTRTALLQAVTPAKPARPEPDKGAMAEAAPASPAPPASGRCPRPGAAPWSPPCAQRQRRP